MAYPATHSTFPSSSFGPPFPHASPLGAPGMPIGPGAHGGGAMPGFVVGHEGFAPQAMPALLPLHERYGFAQPGLTSLAHAMNFHGDWGAPAGLPPPMLTTAPPAGNAPAVQAQALSFLSSLHQQQTSDVTLLRDSHIGRPNDMISHLHPDGTPTEFRSGNTYGVAWLETRGSQRHLCFDLQASNGFSATHSVKLHEADVSGTPASFMAQLAHARRSLFQQACSNQPAGLAVAGAGGFGTSLMGLGLMRELMWGQRTRGMLSSHPGFAESPGAQRQLHDWLDRPAMSHRMNNFMGGGQPFGARFDAAQRQTQEQCLDYLHARQQRFASAHMGQGGPATPGAQAFSSGAPGPGPLDAVAGRRGGARPPGGGGGGMPTPMGTSAPAGPSRFAASATPAPRTGLTIVELDADGKPLDASASRAAPSGSPRATAASPTATPAAPPVPPPPRAAGKKTPPPPPERRTPERAAPTASNPATSATVPAPRPLTPTPTPTPTPAPAAPPPADAAAKAAPADLGTAKNASPAPAAPPPAARPAEQRSTTTEHHHHTTTTKMVPRRPAPPPPENTPPKRPAARPAQPPSAGGSSNASPSSATISPDTPKAPVQAPPSQPPAGRSQPPRRPASPPSRPAASPDRRALGKRSQPAPAAAAPRAAKPQPPAAPVAAAPAKRDVELDMMDAAPLPFVQAVQASVSRAPGTARPAAPAQNVAAEKPSVRSGKGLVDSPAAQPSAPPLAADEKPAATSAPAPQRSGSADRSADLSRAQSLPSYDDAVNGPGKKSSSTASSAQELVERRWAPGTAKGALLGQSLSQMLTQMSEPSSLRKALTDRMRGRKPEDFKDLVLAHVRPHVTEMRLAHAAQASAEEKATHGEAAIRQVMQTQVAASLSQLSPAQANRLFERLGSNKGRMAALQEESRMMSSHSDSFASFGPALRDMAIDVMLSERTLLDGLEDWRAKGLAPNKSAKTGAMGGTAGAGRAAAAVRTPATPPAA